MGLKYQHMDNLWLGTQLQSCRVGEDWSRGRQSQALFKLVGGLIPRSYTTSGQANLGCAFLVNLCLRTISYFYFSISLSTKLIFFSLPASWKLNFLLSNTILVQSLYRHIRSEQNYTDARHKTCIKKFHSSSLWTKYVDLRKQKRSPVPTHGSKWCVITQNCTLQNFLILCNVLVGFFFFFNKRQHFPLKHLPFSSSFLSCFLSRVAQTVSPPNRPQTHPQSHFKTLTWSVIVHSHFFEAAL